MTRILLLLIFLLWLAWTPSADALLLPAVEGLALFFSVFVILVVGLGIWSRMLARRVSASELYRGMARFNRTMLAARAFVPAWFAFGVFALGWGELVRGLLPTRGQWPAELPGTILGTLPAFIAWTALWWSQYPADRALREQALLIQLDANLPIHAPVGFRHYLTAQLRLQLLFTIVPVLLILLARDVVAVLLRQFELTRPVAGQIEGGIMLFAAAGVFVVAPEILRRVLHTQSLPQSPLRQRLEGLCRRNGLRYRDILLWHTDNNMGNAAVMGVVPRFRYILLSDLLLETMTDEQIEAVFAHEVGHVVHRHMSWYVMFILILVLLLAGPGTLVAGWLEGWQMPRWLPHELLLTLAGAGVFLLLFGCISRRFERQADVFAARSMQGVAVVSGGVVSGEWAGHHRSDHSPLTTHKPGMGLEPSAVGPYGAGVFCSALQRVAVVNNIPVNARSWCHGSIATRMGYLRQISEHPKHTISFDRMMRRLYMAMVLSAALFGAWTMAEVWWGVG